MFKTEETVKEPKMQQSFDEIVEEIEELVSCATSISYSLGKVCADGKPKTIKFNSNADQSLYEKEVNDAFIKKCLGEVSSRLKTLKRKQKIFEIRGKKKAPIKVAANNSRLKEPVVMTDQFFKFLTDPSVNLGLANLHLFSKFEDLDEVSRLNGSNPGAVHHLMSTSGMLKNVVEDNKLSEDYSWSADDFDLRKVLAPLLEKRMIRRYNIGQILSIIEHVNDLKKGGRVQTLPEMDRYFGHGTNSSFTVRGREIGNKLDARELLPLAEEVERLTHEKKQIQKHSKYNTEEEKRDLQNKLREVVDSLKEKTDSLRAKMIERVNWASSNPSKLIINLANKNKSVYDILDTDVEDGKPRPFIKKEDSKDGEYGYTHASRMKLLSHLSVQPEFVKTEDPGLVSRVDQKFEDHLNHVDEVLKRLMNVYKSMKPHA